MEQDLRFDLLRFLQEKKRREEIEMARRAGAIAVHNRDGSVKVITLQFVEAVNGMPIS